MSLSVTSHAYQRLDAKPVPAIARCSRCKAAKRVEVMVRRYQGDYGRWKVATDYPTVVCSCGKTYPMITPIQARTTEHKCDSRCTHAKGPNCDCSCGGKNHGSGW